MFIYISKHLSNDGLFTQSIKLEYNNTKTGTLYSYWRFILFAAVSSGVCCPRDLGVDGLASLRRFVPLACGVTDLAKIINEQKLEECPYFLYYPEGFSYKCIAAMTI